MELGHRNLHLCLLLKYAWDYFHALRNRREMKWNSITKHVEEIMCYLDMMDNTVLDVWWGWHKWERGRWSRHTFPVRCDNNIPCIHRASSPHSHAGAHPWTGKSLFLQEAEEKLMPLQNIKGKWGVLISICSLGRNTNFVSGLQTHWVIF